MKTQLLLRYFLLGAVLLFLGAFLLFPIGTVVGVGCDWQLITELFRNRIYVEGLLNSLAVALCTTAIVFVISLWLALLYDRYDFPGKNLCSTALHFRAYRNTHERICLPQPNYKRVSP